MLETWCLRHQRVATALPPPHQVASVRLIFIKQHPEGSNDYVRPIYQSIIKALSKHYRASIIKQHLEGSDGSGQYI
jgi:hypothetical protein